MRQIIGAKNGAFTTAGWTAVGHSFQDKLLYQLLSKILQQNCAVIKRWHVAYPLVPNESNGWKEYSMGEKWSHWIISNFLKAESKISNIHALYIETQT